MPEPRRGQKPRDSRTSDFTDDDRTKTQELDPTNLEEMAVNVLGKPAAQEPTEEEQLDQALGHLRENLELGKKIRDKEKEKRDDKKLDDEINKVFEELQRQ